MGVLSDNPILYREAVPRFVRRMSPRQRVVVALAIVFAAAVLGLMLGGAIGDSDGMLGYVLGSLWGFAAAVLAVAQAARGIAGERAQRTWDLLLITRLRPAEIIFGKLFSTLLPVWAAGLPLLVIALGTAAAGDGASALGVMALYWLAGVVASFSFASVALWCSMRCRTVGSAVALSFGAVFVIALLARVAAFLAVVLLGSVDMGITGNGDLAFWMLLNQVLVAIAYLLPGVVALLDLPARFERLDGYHRAAAGPGETIPVEPEGAGP